MPSASFWSSHSCLKSPISAGAEDVALWRWPSSSTRTRRPRCRRAGACAGGAARARRPWARRCPGANHATYRRCAAAVSCVLPVIGTCRSPRPDDSGPPLPTASISPRRSRGPCIQWLMRWAQARCASVVGDGRLAQLGIARSVCTLRLFLPVQSFAQHRLMLPNLSFRRISAMRWMLPRKCLPARSKSGWFRERRAKVSMISFFVSPCARAAITARMNGSRSARCSPRLSCWMRANSSGVQSVRPALFCSLVDSAVQRLADHGPARQLGWARIRPSCCSAPPGPAPAPGRA